MKKLFLTLALVFTGIFAANAQLWIGGGLGADINKNYTQFSVAPEVGYSFPNSPFTLAIGAGYTYNSPKVGPVTNTLSLQPYFRYVPVTIADKFSLFLDLTGDFGLIDYYSPDGKLAYAVMVQPGIAWMATEHWTAAFRFGKIGYNHNFYKNGEGVPTEGFLLGCDLASPSIRIYYNF
jgi:hypothetical protein